MHPGNLSLFDTPDVPPSCVRTYTLIRPERTASPGHATSPGLVTPQETIHALGLSPGTVSPSSALSGHIKTPPNAIMRYTACEGITTPLDEITDNAQQLASDRAELSPRGEHLDAHTMAPSIWPLGEQTSPVAGETTQVRFGGRFYESRCRFQSAPTSNRMEDMTGLIRQVAQFMGVGPEGASTGSS